LTGVAVLALVFFAGSDGISMADGSGLPAEAGSEQSTKRQAAGGTEETGGADRRKTVRPEVDDTGRAMQYQGIRSCLGDQQRLLTNEVEA
jgi:hypothetical protein